MVDYIIVGLGLAGSAFCERLVENNKTFTVFNDSSQTSSRVAGGLYNPVILKRFTLTWKADEQLAITNDFYLGLEKRLGIKFDAKLPVLRRFASVEEQNLWFEAADKHHLKKYLSTDLISNQNKNLISPHGYGEVLQTGVLDTNLLLSSYEDWLLKEGFLESGTFDYQQLQIEQEYVVYKKHKAKRIVFTEGFGLMQNPFFNYLPMQGSKGEYVIIRARNLKEENIIKSSIFLIPLGNDLYKVGATYSREEKTNIPTSEAKSELLRKLNDVLDCDYEVLEQVAGVRPTLQDRRPLVGVHPTYKNLYVLNGFGSHGVMIGPWASLALYNHIENNSPLDSEMNIKRFEKKFYNFNVL